jgi:hypothetical protein
VNVTVLLHCCAPNNTDPIERGALGWHNPDNGKNIQTSTKYTIAASGNN